MKGYRAGQGSSDSALTAHSRYPPTMPRFLLILVLAALTGCTSYQRPSVRVADVQVGERTDAGLVLKVALEAENRNEFELPLREIHYKVRMNDGQVYTGLRSAEASLRRFGTQRITFPAVIPLSPGAPTPTGPFKVDVSGSLAYLAPGQVAQVLRDLGISRPARAFATEATVDAPKK